MARSEATRRRRTRSTKGSISLAVWDRDPARGGARGLVRRLWDCELNDDTLDDVSYGSGTERWFRCPLGHPPWLAKVCAMTSRRTRDRTTGCPYCAHRMVLAGETDLATTHPVVARSWHPTKNGSLRPEDVLAGSHLEVWWLCSACGHSWRAQPNNRTFGGAGCPACASRTPSRGRTFADVVRIRRDEWSAKNPGRPRDYLPNSNQKIWRVCRSCGGEWEQRIQSWTAGFGHGCRRAASGRSSRS